MTTSQIYQKFLTPKNLQEHMLRVAALCKIITDNWNGEAMDKPSVIKACLMHDIAKPVEFNLSPVNLAKYNTPPEEAANLEKLQKYIKANFGSDEHAAATAICEHLALDKKVVEIVDKMDWLNIKSLLKENNLETLIAVYCDMRIGPKGILSLQARFDDLRNRTNNRNDPFLPDAIIFEQKLQKNVAIDLNGITDNELTSLFPELLNLEI